MQMNASSIVNQKAEWEKLGVKLPAFVGQVITFDRVRRRLRRPVYIM